MVLNIDDFDFFRLKKNLKSNLQGFKSFRLAILGDSSTQFLVIAIKGLAIEYGLNFEIFESDFNQIDQQMFNTSSELNKFEPDYIIIFKSSHKLLLKYNKLDIVGKRNLAQTEIDIYKSYLKISTIDNCYKFIIFNYNEIDDCVFGNSSTKNDLSFLFQLRKLNFNLMELASINFRMNLCDISALQNRIGKLKMFSPSIYVNSDSVLSLEVLPLVANQIVGIINTYIGNFVKCIIVDLDNTIWGGIIGDDGVENIEIGNLGIGKVFSEFQYWLKKMKDRGIILAICSKNEIEVAKKPFLEHEDMILKFEDISIFVANWESKAVNIRIIKEKLNIGYDSIIFLDDNPFERENVRIQIPELIIPELPEDPALYLEYIYNLNIFNTSSFVENEIDRALLFQNEEVRNVEMQNFDTEIDFLRSLNMIATVEDINSFNIPRISQLSFRSNQFNLRTVRYTEDDILKIKNDHRFKTFVFHLNDNFGNHGLICVIVLKIDIKETLFIDSWFMSCRVLKRGMENFTLNTIIAFAKENGFNTIKGEYIETNKNMIVKNHYENLGFIYKEGYWYLDVVKFENRRTEIKWEII
jgi:FkbH-like protein